MGEDRRLGQRRRRPRRDHEVGRSLQRLIPAPHCCGNQKSPDHSGLFLSKKLNIKFNT
jgi:hypothetical protein